MLDKSSRICYNKDKIRQGKRYKNMKIWTKDIVVENREFHLEFWKDYMGLMWTEISEKIVKKPTIFDRKDYRYEQIDKYWSDANPVEKALHEIKKYLNNEKAEKEIEKLLDRFCD